MTVSETTRTEIYQGLWDAKRMVRYYQSMHQKYQKKNKYTMGLLVLFGTSALTALWDKLPGLVQAIMGLAVAILSLWILFADYAAKSAVAHSIALQCDELVNEWANLFAKVAVASETTIDETQARSAMQDLNRRLASTTYASGYAKLTDNAKVNKQASTDAAEELKGSYA